MKVKFTEEKLEQAFTELIAQEGYPHTLGTTLDRKEDAVIKSYLKASAI